MHSTVGSHQLGQIKSKAENILFTSYNRFIITPSGMNQRKQFPSVLSFIDRFSITGRSESYSILTQQGITEDIETENSAGI
jgi:hypothetical protein